MPAAVKSPYEIAAAKLLPGKMSEGEAATADAAPAPYTFTPGILSCSRWLPLSRGAGFPPETPKGIGRTCSPGVASVAVAAPEATTRCLIVAGSATVLAGFKAPSALGA